MTYNILYVSALYGSENSLLELVTHLDQKLFHSPSKDNGNDQGIVQAFIRLLTDEQLALTLGKNGRARAENELT